MKEKKKTGEFFSIWEKVINTLKYFMNDILPLQVDTNFMKSENNKRRQSVKTFSKFQKKELI